MHASLWQNAHVWDYALHVYKTGEVGVKTVAKELGLHYTSLAVRARKAGISNKKHRGTVSTPSSIRERTITKLNKAWHRLLKRVRKPYKRKPTTEERRANALTYYYSTKHVRADKIKANAKSQYDKRKHDPAFMQRKRDSLQGWRDRNPEAAKQARRQWMKDNPEKQRAAMRNWKMNNPDKVRAGRRRHDNKPHRLLIRRLRTRLRELIRIGKAKKQSIRKLIGCTPAHLVAHIQSQFTAGMGWHNRDQWQIDHMRPCASFDLNDPVQLSSCWHWTNLQPLWTKDNQEKGATYVKPL